MPSKAVRCECSVDWIVGMVEMALGAKRLRCLGGLTLLGEKTEVKTPLRG